MRFIIKHEISGRMRIHVVQSRMSYEQADTLLYFLTTNPKVTSAKVYERTCDAVIYYSGSREDMIQDLRKFRYDKVDVPAEIIQNSGRELNATYQEKLVMKIVLRGIKKLFVPYPIRVVINIYNGAKYIRKGIQSLAKKRLDVAVLDAISIAVSLVRGDFDTAGSVMFMLGIGELLEEWTHKKSVGDLARTMSLNVTKVWLANSEPHVLVPISAIQAGDRVIVHMGNMIPFDGEVVEGEAMVNQASLTGESAPVRKTADSVVYAGTVVEEGEVVILVKQVTGSSRFEKIVTMIEESEKLKSAVESKAEHLADKLVPYTLLGTGLVWAFTQNVTKALSVLMVDFSCALKLAMPITVLSAIREANQYHMTVKGGKFLEAVAEADTIVFDKTGTLTMAKPTVADVISFNGDSPDELLRIAACMEEHFPHSVAKAVVNAAREKGLKHEEMHSKVDYIVAHGISTKVNGQKAIIGSHHFVFEDEGCVVPEGYQEQYDNLPDGYSHLYLAIEDQLAAVICIEDPLREEARDAIAALKATGISKIVMMTGDSERTARVIAQKVGVDAYFSEVLPEDKARFIESERALGRTVIMIGDGINDSPALSAADVGIAVSEGAEIAREIADITIGADDLYELLTLKRLSDALMKRIKKNYRFIVGFNAMLIVLGVAGVIQPTTSSLFHNMSTIYIGVKSMGNLLPEQDPVDVEAEIITA